MPPCLRMNPGGKRGYREEEIAKKNRAFGGSGCGTLEVLKEWNEFLEREWAKRNG
jgi:hypothetical protein